MIAIARWRIQVICIQTTSMRRRLTLLIKQHIFFLFESMKVNKLIKSVFRIFWTKYERKNLDTVISFGTHWFIICVYVNAAYIYEFLSLWTHIVMTCADDNCRKTLQGKFLLYRSFAGNSEPAGVRTQQNRIASSTHVNIYMIICWFRFRCQKWKEQIKVSITSEHFRILYNEFLVNYLWVNF
jgi:hypothetical protein